MVDVNPTFHSRLPQAIQKDPESRKYFEQLERIIFQLRERTGGGNDLIAALGTAANADIIGTVSETSGTPTGSIFEEGSNANGYYIRYASGKQECWHWVTTGAGNTANGALWISPAVDWTFPKTFISVPAVTAYVDFVSVSSAGCNPVGVSRTSTSDLTTASVQNNRVWYQASSATIVVRVAFKAEGRWFT